jgi:hypothetical protein
LAGLRCIATPSSGSRLFHSSPEVFHQGGKKAAWRAAWSGSLVRLFQETIDQTVGAAAVGEGEMAGKVARR